MSASLLVLSFDINLLDKFKLPEDIRTTAIAYAKLSHEKGILPLLGSSLTDFETRFIQAGRYFYNYIIQVGSLIASRYEREEEYTVLNIPESLFDIIDGIHNELLRFGDEPAISLMMDGIDVIENFIRLSTMSTSDLDPSYYTMAFDAYINVSVCMSAFWAVRVNEMQLKHEIRELLVQKFEDNTDILNELVKAIQIQEDKKAVTEGRREYAEGKVKRFTDANEFFESLNTPQS
jgi:hypothetical protein